MVRRRFLFGGAAALGAAGFAAWRYWPALWNSCLGRLPDTLAGHDLVRAAWDGLDAAQVWDAHVHLAGIGDAGSGIFVNPKMESLLEPDEFVRRLFFLNAGCAHAAPGRVDRAYLERLEALCNGLDLGAKLLLYAFDRAHDERGAVQWERTGFYVPDRYARDAARAHPRRFEWAASIHPYRGDCVEALEGAQRDGARAVKWLPAAMGIDPAAPRCEPLYAALARLKLPLITHAGGESAVKGSGLQDYGNPLRLRRALDAGVRVVIAHCASLGADRDLDRGPNGPVVASFELFARLMGEARYEGRLYGDISALTQRNRAAPALARTLERGDWHARLLNGSDYPLPGVMPIVSLDGLAALGLIEPAAAGVLQQIRAHNALLFDFVLKRHLRSNGKQFANSVFETRRFFERG